MQYNIKLMCIKVPRKTGGEYETKIYEFQDAVSPYYMSMLRRLSNQYDIIIREGGQDVGRIVKAYLDDFMIDISQKDVELLIKKYFSNDKQEKSGNS